MGRTNYMDSLPKFRCDGVSFRRGLCSIMQPYFHQIKFWERPWQNVHLSQGASIARYRSPFGRAAFNRQLTQEYGSKLKPFHCRQISMKVTGKQSNVKETVIPEPDFRIPILLSGLAGSLIYNGNLVIAAPIGLLGLLLFFQATRVRFVFDDEALEVRVGAELKESGENVFVGGKNRWKYSTFVNWELWWPSFPVLVYFKEIQTKPEGQIHFFPVIFNGKQLYEVMIERAGPSKNSGRK